MMMHRGHDIAIGYSIFRILWAPMHLIFAGIIAEQAVAERMLPTLPYPSPLAVFSRISLEGLLLIAALHGLFAILLFVGFRTRVMQCLLALSAPLLFFHSASTYQNHFAFYLWVNLWLTAAPSERYFSLDALLRWRKLPPNAFERWRREAVSLFAQRMILLEASFLYLFAGVNKLSPAWFLRWSATQELPTLLEGKMLLPVWNFLLAHDIAWIPIGILALFMLTLSLGIFLGNRFPVILLLAATMHLLLDVHLHIMLFTQMMLAILVLALFPLRSERLRAIMDVIARSDGAGLHRVE